jgi:hypothetical protein
VTEKFPSYSEPPLTEEELAKLVEHLGTHEGLAPGDRCFHDQEILRLVADVKRLRNLVKRVQPLFVGRYTDARNPGEQEALLALEQELGREARR